ncbi:hypothetical protein JTB14_033601 [Gonioctena quinquepunctata]|nr:hypothetical protein JTB14_033601 [Gonioctena quinquepunctata]
MQEEILRKLELRSKLDGWIEDETVKKNKKLLFNQFKIGLRKDFMNYTGVLLRRGQFGEISRDDSHYDARKNVEHEDFASGNR